MSNISLFFAWRYLRGTTQEQTISSMVMLSFVSIFIGSCALALVAFVMEGIEHATHEKLRGIHAPLLINGYGQALDASGIRKVLQEEFPEIVSTAAHATQYALAQIHDEEEYSLAVIQGIEPENEARVSTLGATLVSPSKTIPSLPDLLINNRVLVGHIFAKNASAGVGDTVRLLVPELASSRNKRIQFDAHDVTIAGIFKTGIDEFDSNVIFCSLDFLTQLFPDAGIGSIGLKIESGSDEQTFITKLGKRLELPVMSWKDLYPALVSALILEKYAMFFILALITVVASMSIISLLFMLITQKRADIALLVSMGVSDSTIKRTFIAVGMTIACCASFCGIFLAMLLGYLLDTYQLIKLPDAYYVSHVPASISWHIPVLVFAVVMILSFIASWWPTQKIRRIDISQILRFEA